MKTFSFMSLVSPIKRQLY